jgi:hypothetical protein
VIVRLTITTDILFQRWHLFVVSVV